jgi:hypothetical protein
MNSSSIQHVAPTRAIRSEKDGIDKTTTPVMPTAIARTASCNQTIVLSIKGDDHSLCCMTFNSYTSSYSVCIYTNETNNDCKYIPSQFYFNSVTAEVILLFFLGMAL